MDVDQEGGWPDGGDDLPRGSQGSGITNDAATSGLDLILCE